MKKIIAILIAICLLCTSNPVPSFAGGKRKGSTEHKAGHKYNQKHKKKHKFKLFRHRRRERAKHFNTGHTEFKGRSKRERKQLGRHHIKP